uniref:Uncharacterized protein n=1 Tax=Physcomitrium patens TaxID=3218 RepID=A0A2K1J125_PHYPA|nr:hypothetical protein PHYPA_023128 [Physcomitrium patens]
MPRSFIILKINVGFKSHFCASTEPYAKIKTLTLTNRNPSCQTDIGYSITLTVRQPFLELSNIIRASSQFPSLRREMRFPKR